MGCLPLGRQEGWQRKEASCPFIGREAFYYAEEDENAIWDVAQWGRKNLNTPFEITY